MFTKFILLSNLATKNRVCMNFKTPRIQRAPGCGIYGSATELLDYVVQCVLST